MNKQCTLVLFFIRQENLTSVLTFLYKAASALTADSYEADLRK